MDIGWAVDGSTCGLAVWGEFRAFLGVTNSLVVRKTVVMDAEENGIPPAIGLQDLSATSKNKIDH